jgi:TP901 family phage tail tape measure protein
VAGYNLGEARGKIVLETDFKSLSEAQKQLDSIKGQASKSSDEVMGTGDALNKVAGTSALAGAGIAAGFAVAVKGATDFEFGLSAIQAVSGATTGEMDSIRDAALRIGKDTSYSASEAATAMEELLKAGISVDDVLNGAADATVALAAAGGVDLPTAATIASNAMNQFGLAAEDMVNVTDLIAGAANASAIDMEQFSYSMSQVGAVANLAGLDFEETATAIAELGNAGIVGSDAGTSLKSMLMNLEPTTKKATMMMEDLGLFTEDAGSAFYDAQGNLKSLRDIQELLGKSLEGLSEKQKQAALETIFGSDAIRAAAILADNGAAGYDKMSTAMNKVSAADVAATRLDNMKGSMEALSGSVETVAIQVGSLLIPFLTDLVDNIGSVVDQFSALSSGQQQAIVAAVGIAGALLLGVAATIKTVQAIQSAARVYKSLALAIGGIKALQQGYAAATYGAAGATYANTVAGKVGAAAAKAYAVGTAIATGAQRLFNAAVVANPIGAIIAVIIAVVAALIYFFTQTELGKAVWENIVNFLIAAWGNIVSVATSVFGALGSFFSDVWDNIKNAISTAIAFITNIFLNWTPLGIFISNFGAIAAFFTTIFEAVRSAIATAIGFIIGVFNNFVTGVQVAFAAVLSFIQPFVDWFNAYMVPLISAAIALVVAIVNYLVQAVKAYFTMVLSVVTNILNSVKAFISSVWNAIMSFWMSVISKIVSYITARFNVLKNTVTSIFNAVKSFITSVWNAVYSAISNVVQRIVSFVQARFNALRSAVTSVFNAVRSVASSVWNSVYSTISGIVNRIVSTISSVFNTVVGRVTSAFSGVVAAISGPFDQAIALISGVKDRIIGIFAGAGSWLLSAGRNIISGLIQGVQNMIGNLTSKLREITNLIPKNKGPERVDKVLLQENGELIMQSLINGLASKTPALTAKLGGLTKMIPSAVGAPSVGYDGPAAPAPVSRVVNNTFHVTTNDDPTLWAREVSREFERDIL